MPNAHFTRNLKRFFPALEDVSVAGATVAEVLAAVDGIYPGVADYVVDERGALRKHVNIFVGDSLVADRKRLSDPLEPDAEVHIIQALSGG